MTRWELVRGGTPSRPPPAGLRPTSSGPLFGLPMTNSQLHAKKPSPKQLRYLKDLAQKRGESFTYPTTAGQASAEIERLKGRKPMSRTDRSRESRELSRQMAGRRGDAAAVRPSELTGYGSSATWR